MRPALRRWAPRLALAVASLALALALLEGALRLAPGLFRGRLGNYAWSKYGSFPGGIYFREPVTGMNFMRPGFATVNYWNGYSWRHRTDAFGFRDPTRPPGPAGDQGREVLLLGDSLIYGHGVEEEQTVAHLLRARGRAVYNMARQGDCLFNHYVLLRLYLERFRPRTVVVFVFINDFHDLEIYRSPRQIAEAPEIARYDYEAVRRNVEELGARTPAPPARLVWSLASMRLMRGVLGGAARRLVRARWLARAEAAGEDRPPFVRAVLEPERFRRLAGYYRTVLPDLDRRVRAAGAELQVVLLDLENGAWPREVEKKLGRMLRRLSARTGIPVHQTRGVFLGCRECFLPGDGHFTAEGHRRLADWLEEEVLVSPPARVAAPARPR